MINKSILKSCHNEGFEEDEVYGAYKIFFGTLFSDSRLRILNELRKGKKNVGELMSSLGYEQTAISHNLSRLKSCGFITVKPEGKFRYYAINEKTILPLMDLIDVHMKENCIHILRGTKK